MHDDMNQDDTFKRLKKWSYNQLNDAYNAPWNLSIDASWKDYNTHFELLLIKAGWTMKEWSEIQKAIIKKDVLPLK